MTEAWREEIRHWASDAAQSFANQPGIVGVVIGGSIARGQEWRHSDLELGVLVEARRPDLPYFNIFRGRGVEAIQLVRSELETQIAQVAQGNLAPLEHWPIQLYACRVISDPSGALRRFKTVFDANLFLPQIVAGKLATSQEKINEHLSQARALLTLNRPRQAVTLARVAMNEAILGLHWAHNTLPRSQSRTDSRLHQLCRRHDRMAFYALYREVFGLANLRKAIKIHWPRVKQAALEIPRLWGGDSARDFFDFAVDGNFQWRQNAGILTVYRLYIPILGGAEKGIGEKLDDPAWAGANQEMLQFLGLAEIDAQAAAHLIACVETAQTIIRQDASASAAR